MPYAAAVAAVVLVKGQRIYLYCNKRKEKRLLVRLTVVLSAYFVLILLNPPPFDCVIVLQ
jgi:hypothetical protein